MQKNASLEMESPVVDDTVEVILPTSIEVKLSPMKMKELHEESEDELKRETLVLELGKTAIFTGQFIKTRIGNRDPKVHPGVLFPSEYAVDINKYNNEVELTRVFRNKSGDIPINGNSLIYSVIPASLTVIHEDEIPEAEAGYRKSFRD